MSTSFRKADLAALVSLPTESRALALLAALRFLTEDDLGDAQVPPAVAEILARRGLVHRFPLQRKLTDPARTDVYALSRRGAVELARALDIDASTIPSSTKKSCTRSPMFLDHTLATARFAHSLARALADPEAPQALLSWESDPERLADAVHLLTDAGYQERQPLVADGLAVVRSGRGPEGLLVEVDRGTERPSYLGRKLAGYLEWWKTGGHERRFDLKAVRLLTVAPDEKRSERLRDACRQATGGSSSGMFWFASEEAIARDGILAPVWSTLKSERISLWA